MYFPFIDHCIEEFEQRFPDSQNSLFLGYKSLPYNVLQIKDEEIQKLEDFYGNDLPNKPTFKAEVEVWKTKCSCISQKESEKIKLLDVLILADSEFSPMCMK